MNPLCLKADTPPQTPTIAVIGMGYVGALSAAGLCAAGRRVIGVETNQAKLAMLQRGDCPVREPGLTESIAQAHRRGLFSATRCLGDAVGQASIIMIAVGTPSLPNGRVNLDAIDRVTHQIAQALAGHRGAPLVMVRSTVPPGTTEKRIGRVLRAVAPGARLCHHPEFLREGSAMADWSAPPMIVYGCRDADVAAVESALNILYRSHQAPRVRLESAESELVKYACNTFQALKIDFANEIGTIGAACGADPQNVMAAFCQDKHLNLSSAYLRPGFAFGGSCLPKDTRTLGALARDAEVHLPLIDSVLASNQAHLSRQIQRILEFGRIPTLLVGLSFKSGSDDLRESPMVELAERLLGKGVTLTIHEPDLMPSRLIGTNAQYIRQHLPHLHLLLRDDPVAAAKEAELVVIAKPIAQIDALQARQMVDLRQLGSRTRSNDTAVRKAA